MSNHAHAYISLGSNIGEAVVHLRSALDCLRSLDAVDGIAASPVYMTEPQGDPDQPWFANQVARLLCAPSVTPETLLQELLAIERRLGRVRDPERSWGPRIIDLDLLLFDQEVRNTETLVLPHPRMAERAFVLVPLSILDPNVCFPDGRTVRDILESLSYKVEGFRILQSQSEAV